MGDNMNLRTKKLVEFAQQHNLNFDNSTLSVYGHFQGFDVIINRINNQNFNIFMSLRSYSGALQKDEFKQFTKETKELFSAQVNNGQTVTFTTTSGLSDKGCFEKLHFGLVKTVEFLRTSGYTSVCHGCSDEKETSATVINGHGFQLCDSCFDNVSQSLSEKDQAVAEKSENYAFGIVGALIGSLVGVASIVIIGQLGYVSAISGLIMAVATLMGYEKLAGKLSKIGIIISLAIMATMVFVGNRLDWAFAIAKEFETDIFDAFASVPALIEYAGAESDYNTNLIMIGIFVLVGCIGPVINAFKNPLKKSKIVKLMSRSQVQI